MKKLIVVLAVLLCLVGMTNAQSKFGLSVQGALSLPLGSSGDDYKTGFGGFGTVTYTVENNLDIIATAGYLTYKNKNYDDITFSKVLILGGVRYYLAAKNFRPYLTAEAGVSTNKSSVESLVIPGGILRFDSTTDFALEAGAGFLYKLSDKLDFDVNASLFGGRGETYVNILAGVHFAF